MHTQAKERYYVTVPTYLFGYLRRVLPTRVLDRILMQVGREEMRSVPALTLCNRLITLRLCS